TLVDQPYAAIHRLRLMEGAWFTERDAARLAPAIIITSDLWQLIGSPDLRTHPTLELVTPERSVTAVVTGITESPSGSAGQDLSSFMLLDSFDRAGLTMLPPEQRYLQAEAWLPPEIAEELSHRLAADVRAALGAEWQ